MAVEQSGTEPVPELNPAPDPDQPAQPAAAAEPAAGSSAAATQPADVTQPADAKPDLEELKRKFREALDRKHSSHASAQGADDTGKVHGSHGPAVSRRSFRRKSGG
jgi:hypothetical protein